MNEFTSTRSNHLIDPVLHAWGWEVPIYLFLGGMVAGIMLLSGWMALRRSEDRASRALSLLPWASPLLISIGMMFLWLDLENGFNAFRFYFVFRPGSPMSWGSWILIGIYPASILLAWVLSPAGFRESWTERLSFVPGFERISGWAEEHTRYLAAANIVMGAALGVYTGVLLGTMAARPLWNSAILGPLFLVSGISTGAAFMLLYRLSDRERLFLGRLDMSLITVELLLLALWMIGLATAGAPSRGALWALFGGPYTAAFWTLVVALGLLTPLFGEWLELRHGIIPGRLPAILVLVGGLSLRWILVYAGQFTSWAGNLTAALH
jgi:formate-dependent nitrite reductase membrane component NrfD